jgi:hypothetical protein
VSVFFLKSCIPVSPDQKDNLNLPSTTYKIAEAITEYTTIIKNSCRARILNLPTEIKMGNFETKDFKLPDKIQEKLTM